MIYLSFVLIISAFILRMAGEINNIWQSIITVFILFISIILGGLHHG